MTEKEGALLIPCSGIGKVHGLIGREAVFQALEGLEREGAETLCLALIVTGDEEALEAIRSRPCITVDGCPKLCAYKNVDLAGGRVIESVRVVDAFKGHKGAKPGSATSLTDDGWVIAGELAQHLRQSCKTAAGSMGE